MITLEAQPDEIYDIELEHGLLEANAKLAQENRALLDRNGITAIDFMGAIGSGKTTLITKLVEMLKDKIGVAVFNGDATTRLIIISTAMVFILDTPQCFIT